MINSLSKDSHIPHYCRFQKLIMPSEISTYENMGNHAPVNNSSVIVKNPAKISFSGALDTAKARENFKNQTISFSNPNKLIFEEQSPFLQISEDSIRFLEQQDKSKDSKSLYRAACDLINTSIDYLHDTKINTDESTKKFLDIDGNKERIQTLVEYSKKLLIKKEDEEKLKSGILTPGELEKRLHKGIKKLIGEATNILKVVKAPKQSKMYTSSNMMIYLSKAAKSPVIFSSLFALMLTCTLRPASIMALPGQKKNKDDKKYAAAQSVASGIIGYAISVLIFAPITKALKVIGNNPEIYLNNENAKYLGDIKAKNFKASLAFNSAKRLISICPEIIFTPPKAILTIALIPPILKYVFGWEKKNANKVEKPEIEKPVSNDIAVSNLRDSDSKENKFKNSSNGGNK